MRALICRAWGDIDTLELGASEVLYIGDMVIDIEAARAAGVAVWTIPTGSCSPEELDQAGPDGCITSIADLLDALPPL